MQITLVDQPVMTVTLCFLQPGLLQNRDFVVTKKKSHYIQKSQ